MLHALLAWSPARTQTPHDWTTRRIAAADFRLATGYFDVWQHRCLMPPIFHSTHPVTMTDGIRDQRRVFRWALPTSAVLHLLAAALLLSALPVSPPQPQKEQAIGVDLVPPPKPSEKAKPPPPAKPPKPEEPPEAKVEMPPPAHPEAGPQRPVFQFGEKDAGPRKSLDGNSAEDDSEQLPAPQDPNKQDLAQPPAVTAADGKDPTPPPGAFAPPKPKPADVAKVQNPMKLQQAKKLFSQTATGDPIATTAMRNVPRPDRIGQLCFWEVREQLRHASPPYFPDVLRPFRLKAGNIMQVSRTEFRAGGQWYALSFRCEVDPDATKVVSFAFRVGDPVPAPRTARQIGSPD
ncbi:MULTISPECIES: DUF930 domain-containing protein [unclassified Mesorhizobium]|uniref:DUF930 domain-containing protein n=1 Tax=unclassified Mesorhizobium TaxID=325217 RepID=UPI001FEFCA4A|nr:MULTISPECIES: DUF930 domain-containing protein [unclassified Mesorhizobium]